MQLLLLLLSLVVVTMSHHQQQQQQQQQQHPLLYEPNAPDYTSASLQQSLFDKLAPDPALSTFMDVLTQVDVIFKLLNNTEHAPFTVFCPVNSAFRHELDVHTRGHLDEFLRNHIVPNHKLDADTLRRLHSLQTMLPAETINVQYHSFSKRLVLNQHAVVDTAHAVQAVNGIAYKINHLLRPAVEK